jgi:hypothetical protein
MEVLQTSALPLGDGADRDVPGDPIATRHDRGPEGPRYVRLKMMACHPKLAAKKRAKDGAGNGIRTRDFDLGKVALYH